MKSVAPGRAALAPSGRLKPGFAVVLDRRAFVGPDDRLLAGGRPLRMVDLGAEGAAQLEPLLEGRPLPVTHGNAALVEQLLDLDLVQPVPPGASGREQVTVVVPVRDHPTELRTLLSNPLAFRGVAGIIVVDDGSSDPRELEEVVSGVPDMDVRLVRCQASSGPAAARNRGAALADSELLAFVDADCRPEAGWLDPLVGHFDDAGVGAVAPRIRAEVGDVVRTPFTEALLAFEMARGPLEFGPDPASVGPGRTLLLVPSAALVVRRSAFDAVGGFDERFRRASGEDTDFEWRLSEAGWSVRYEPRATVNHPARPSAVAALKQRYNYGLTSAELARRHDYRMLHIEPWTFAALVAAATVGLVPAGATAGAGLLWPASRWARSGLTWRQAVRRRASDQLAEAHGLALSLWRPYWPLTIALALCSRRFRRVAIAALLGAPLIDWMRRRPPVSPVLWGTFHVAEQVAGGTGIWAGCWRARSFEVLWPAGKRAWAGARPAQGRG